MSFLKKIFGSKKEHACLVINDAYLEGLQFKQNGSKAELIGVNKVDLEEGVVENGFIKNESKFQIAVANLFSDAQPQPIQTNRLYINIPFGQVYPFVKTFPKHAKEERMRIEMEELIKSHSPFSIEELVVDYEKKINKKINYSAMAYPKMWRNMVYEACSEIEITDLHFVPESMAQLGLSREFISGHFALFSWHEGKVYLSLFYDDFLYDSFALKSPFDADNKNSAPLLEEFKKAVSDFENHFNEKIDSLYFAGFPKNLHAPIKKVFQETKLPATYLREADTKISKFISVEDYSPTLVGLGMRSLMYKSYQAKLHTDES